MKKYIGKKLDEFHVTEDGIEVWCEEMGDGHHTISELYEHRHALFIALCKIYDNYITPINSSIRCWKSKLHYDGTMYDGWFILGMELTQFTGPPLQISYHLPMKYWVLCKVMERDHAPEWDGHTSKDVLNRLLYKL